MCQFKSGILLWTADINEGIKGYKIYYSKKSESHQQIYQEFISELRGYKKCNIISWEIVPAYMFGDREFWVVAEIMRWDNKFMDKRQLPSEVVAELLRVCKEEKERIEKS